MKNEPTIEEKRKLIKETGDYYNHWSPDNWLVVGEKYTNPDWAGVSTEHLYNALTYEELPIVYKENKFNINNK